MISIATKREATGGARSPDRDWKPLSAEQVAADLKQSHPQYEVVEPIGRGGMGAVYRANNGGKAVAVKVLRPDAYDDPEYVKRFIQEIKILRSLDHPNIVRILDSGKTEYGQLFFVMELLHGETLATKLASEGRFGLPETVRIIASVCAGIDFVHRKHNLVHRDLKAANIFPAKGGRTVVLDFGIAKDIGVWPSTQSRAKGSPGTPGHMAPEVVKGEPATPTSDVFSIGVVLFQMVSGGLPGEGWPELPPELRSLEPVVQKALSKGQEKRFPTPADLSAAGRPKNNCALTRNTSATLQACAIAPNARRGGSIPCRIEIERKVTEPQINKRI